MAIPLLIFIIILLIALISESQANSTKTGVIPGVFQLLNLYFVNQPVKIYIKIVAIFLRKHGPITAKQNQFLLDKISSLYILPKRIIMKKIAKEIRHQKLYHTKNIEIPNETHTVRIDLISFIFKLSKTGKSEISPQDLLILEDIRKYLKITRLVYQKIKNRYVTQKTNEYSRNIPPKKAQNYNLSSAFATLFLTSTASLKEIKKSYRELAKKYHPDLHKRNNLSKEYATKKFMEITQAYDFLTNWFK